MAHQRSDLTRPHLKRCATSLTCMRVCACVRDNVWWAASVRQRKDRMFSECRLHADMHCRSAYWHDAKIAPQVPSHRLGKRWLMPRLLSLRVTARVLTLPSAKGLSFTERRESALLSSNASVNGVRTAISSWRKGLLVQMATIWSLRRHAARQHRHRPYLLQREGGKGGVALNYND